MLYNQIYETDTGRFILPNYKARMRIITGNNADYIQDIQSAHWSAVPTPTTYDDPKTPLGLYASADASHTQPEMHKKASQ